MFSNPIKTGAIILGASQFDNFPESNRKVFANAADEAARFFENETSGLGIPHENILNRFNSPELAPELLTEVLKFAEEGVREGGRPSFKDLFVYIVTHGVDVADHPLQLMIKSSKDHQDGSNKPDEYIEFKSLFDGLMSVAHCRVYFIVDACYSGKIAKEDLSHQQDFSDGDVYSNVLFSDGDVNSNVLADHKVHIERGAVLFLSNNRDKIGLVQADDASILKRPMFSQMLFGILKEGKENAFSYGFSFQLLKYLCIERMEAFLATQEVLPNEERIDPFCTSFDVFDYHQSETSGLSNAAVFPNNDPTRVNRNAVAREIRIAYKNSFEAQSTLSVATKRIVDLENRASANTNEISNLKKQLNDVTERLNETQTKLAVQKGQATALSKANRILVIFAMLAVPLVCLGFVALDPEGVSPVWSNIVSLFKNLGIIPLTDQNL